MWLCRTRERIQQQQQLASSCCCHCGARCRHGTAAHTKHTHHYPGSTQSSKARTKTSRVSKARALLHMRAVEGGTSRSHRECWVARCTAILEAQQALLVQWTAFQRRRRDTSTHWQAGNWLRWHMPCALSLDGQCCLLQLCSPLSTLTRKHSHHMP